MEATQSKPHEIQFSNDGEDSRIVVLKGFAPKSGFLVVRRVLDVQSDGDTVSEVIVEPRIMAMSDIREIRPSRIVADTINDRDAEISKLYFFPDPDGSVAKPWEVDGSVLFFANAMYTALKFGMANADPLDNINFGIADVATETADDTTTTATETTTTAPAEQEAAIPGKTGTASSRDDDIDTTPASTPNRPSARPANQRSGSTRGHR